MPRGMLVYSQLGLMLYDGGDKWEMVVENKSGEPLRMSRPLVTSEGIYIDGMNEKFAEEAKSSSWKIVNFTLDNIYCLLVWKGMFVGRNWADKKVVVIDPKSRQIEKNLDVPKYYRAVIVDDELFFITTLQRFISFNLHSSLSKERAFFSNVDTVFAMVVWRREIFMFWVHSSTNSLHFSSYSIDTDTWEHKNAGMERDRRAISAAVYEDKLFVFGGVAGDSESASVVDCYDLASEQWSCVAEASGTIWYCTAVTIL